MSNISNFRISGPICEHSHPHILWPRQPRIDWARDIGYSRGAFLLSSSTHKNTDFRDRKEERIVKNFWMTLQLLPMFKCVYLQLKCANNSSRCLAENPKVKTFPSSSQRYLKNIYVFKIKFPLFRDS